MQFLPSNNIIVQLGDTIQWTPLDPPTMTHTITSDNIPSGAVPFDQVWQLPADTFFQYIPQVAGIYQYVCTPHIPIGMIGEFTVTNVGNTQTYVPDNIFEAYLEANNMGNGIANDDYVPTANIDTVTSLDVDNLNISDLTGIEDFSALNYLNCEGNQLTSLDVSQNTVLYSLECGGNNLIKLDLSNNPNLEELHCSENQLSCLNLRSGGNQNIWEITADEQDVLVLSCVEVDDLAYSNNNWISNYDFSFDIGVSFSENCNNDCSNSSTLVLDIGHKNKILLKTIDIFGRETKEINQLLFYIYDDGTVEKIIIIE